MPSKTAAGMAAHAVWLCEREASNKPRKTSHSLTKPLSGGSPEIAAAPSANSPAVHGIVRHSPPRRLISLVPVACSTEPAPKKSSDLNNPWFHTCSRPPANARRPQVVSPCSTATRAKPSPIKMIPMFSTL